jgi:hypothetical protein
MIELNFIHQYASLLILLVSFILIYAALTAAKIPGDKIILAIVSLLLSLIFISSEKAVNYIFSVIPFLTLVMTIAFFFIIMLVLIAKEIDPFKKPLAITSMILGILIVLMFAFNQFPTLHGLLPNTSGTGLDSNLRIFKDWIYSSDVIQGLVFIISIGLVGFFMLKAKGK